MPKITQVIEYAGLQLHVAKHNGHDVVPLKPLSDLFGLKWEVQRKKITKNHNYIVLYGVCNVTLLHNGKQNRKQTCIALSRVSAFLTSLNSERMRVMGNIIGSEYIKDKQKQWSEAYHQYELLNTHR